MKKLSEPVRKVKAQAIGMDVHKKTTVYCVLDRGGRTVEEGSFPSTRSDLISFLKRVVGRKKSHLTFEASRSSLWVYEIISKLVGAERTHVAQAKKIRAIANTKEKNDRNDAWWLAYLTHEGRLPEAYVPPAQILELRIATRERIFAVRQRTKTVNRLKGHLAQIGEIVPGSTIKTEEALLFLAEIALSTPGMRGRALRGCIDELEYLDATIAQWEETIEELAKNLPEIGCIAKAMPGFGTNLSSVVIAETGDLTRFVHCKSYGRYTGLTPSDRSTGGRSIHGGISREGNSHLRWALTQAAMACCRSRNGPGVAVGDWIRAKEKRMGIKSKARAAGARKLAECIWRLFHYGELFDPARPFGGPRASA
jgi:transposase